MTPPSDACTIPKPARVTGGKLRRPKGAKVKVARRGGIYIVRTTSAGITQRTAYVTRGKKKRALPDFEYRGCGDVKEFRLSGPRFTRTLKVFLRAEKGFPIRIVRRGKVVRTLDGSATVRGLQRGTYKVRAGGVTLTTRRL